MAKSIAGAIFGEVSWRVKDVNGNLIKNGTIELVDDVNTAGRFSNLIEEKTDVSLFFPTATMERIANRGVKFTNPFGFAYPGVKAKKEDLVGFEGTTLLEQIKYIANKKGKIVYGSDTNCTAEIWGQTLLDLYGPGTEENINIELYANPDREVGVNCDIDGNDHWYQALVTKDSETFTLLNRSDVPELNMTDFTCPMLKRDQINEKLVRAINIVLSTQLKASEIGIDKTNALIKEPKNNSESCLLDGVNIGENDNIYQKFGLHSSAGRYILQFGNITENLKLVDETTGLNNTWILLNIPSTLGYLCSP